MTEQQLLDLEPALAGFLDRFLGCCAYRPTFAHLGTYVRGLLSELPRKSVEPIALRAGTPVRTLQEFLKDHAWDFAAVRDRLAVHALERLATAADPAGLGTVGVIDETSSVKQGDKTPGVQRQYLGCLGKVDNGIVTVHLALAKGRYKSLIDFELFLPESWSDDPRRCRAAGIPDGMVHRPKSQIALEQIDRAAGNGLVMGWLCFDEGMARAPASSRGCTSAVRVSSAKCRARCLVWPSTAGVIAPRRQLRRGRLNTSSTPRGSSGTRSGRSCV